MAGYRRANYYELCRLCTSSEGTKMHIFREEGQRRQLLTKIQICLPLQVLEGDSLPNIICMDCVERLEWFYDFRESCINAEAMLEGYFSSLKFNEEFRKTGKCYVKEVPKKKEAPKKVLPLEPVVKPDINITKIIPISSQNRQIEESAIIKQVVPVDIQPDEDVQQFEFVVEEDDRPNDDFLRKSSVDSQILMEFDFIKDDSPMKADDIDRTSIDQIGEFLRIKPIPATTIIRDEDSSMAEARCSRCNKTFYTGQELIEHECGGVQLNSAPSKSNLPHIDEACYLCEICSRPFRRKEHLIQHSKLHTGERPYPCTTCGKTFSRKEHLVRHTTCHTGEKQHDCDICSKSFSRRDNLLKHRKTHGVGGPFVCETCGKTFTMRHYYLMHKTTHTNEPPNARPFKCDQCGKSFTLRQYLLNHIARHRNNTLKSDQKDKEDDESRDDQDELEDHIKDEEEGLMDEDGVDEEDPDNITVQLPSADETAESLAAGQQSGYVQIVELQPADEETAEAMQDQRNSFVQIVSLKEDQGEACA